MDNFYQNLRPFTDFKYFMEKDKYQKVPDSWWVFITDIKGSTLAVKEGKYRDVNMVGALGITAVLNATKISLPFVFGGDGGTILVPSELKEIAQDALEKCIYIAKNNYKLELRVGAVSVKEIFSLGGSLEVAKYELSFKNYIAQIRGGGLTIAEKLVKSQNSPYLLKEKVGNPNLDGLTCRWAPVNNTKGTILTLLIHLQDLDYVEYENVVYHIESILKRKLKEASPVREHKLRASWPPPMHLEAKTKAGNYFFNYFKVFFTNILVYAFAKFNMKTKTFSMEKYKKEMEMNSDYKKFDDTLRMVIDCSKEESAAITKMLKARQSLSPLVFGYHNSTQAVMTCLVFSSEQNEHFHFIDGSHGGYTQAAVEFKKQFLGVKKAA